MRAYADAYGIDGSNFHFVTGERSAVRLLIKSLGVTAIQSGDNVMHSLAIVLVDRDRNIVLRSDKSAWEVDTFLKAIENL